MANWYSADGDEAERLVAAWPGAPIENSELCGLLLATAKTQVIAYARPIDESKPLPDNYVLAQLQQAKNLWSAGRADENGEVGSEGYQFTPRPLDKTIRGMLRPPEVSPYVL